MGTKFWVQMRKELNAAWADDAAYESRAHAEAWFHTRRLGETGPPILHWRLVRRTETVLLESE